MFVSPLLVLFHFLFLDFPFILFAPHSPPAFSQKSCVCGGFQRFGLGFSVDFGIHRGQQLEPLPIEHRATAFIPRRVLSSLPSSRFPTVRRPSKAQFNIRRFHFFAIHTRWLRALQRRLGPKQSRLGLSVANNVFFKTVVFELRSSITYR